MAGFHFCQFARNSAAASRGLHSTSIAKTFRKRVKNMGVRQRNDTLPRQIWVAVLPDSFWFPDWSPTALSTTPLPLRPNRCQARPLTSYQGQGGQGAEALYQWPPQASDPRIVGTEVVLSQFHGAESPERCHCELISLFGNEEKQVKIQSSSIL